MVNGIQETLRGMHHGRRVIVEVHARHIGQDAAKLSISSMDPVILIEGL